MAYFTTDANSSFGKPPLDVNGDLAKLELTHWGRDKMAAIFQTTFSNAFSWMKIYEFQLMFHWSLFLRVELTIFQHWLRQWLCAHQATCHYLNQWWWSLLTHICVTRPQWVKRHDDIQLAHVWYSMKPMYALEPSNHIPRNGILEADWHSSAKINNHFDIMTCSINIPAQRWVITHFIPKREPKAEYSRMAF